MQNFKNIIFDLGGVILDVDFSKTQKAFAELGVTNFDSLFNQHYSNPLFADLEIGKISPEAFYNAFRQAVNVDLKDMEIENAWNALVGSFKKEKLDWLEKISKKYNIYLFSNTNAIHHAAFQKNFREVTGKKSFDDYFVQAWYSHTIGFRKPELAAFEKVLELGNLNAAETVFIDDTIGNVESAKKVGLQTIYLEKPAQVEDLAL